MTAPIVHRLAFLEFGNVGQGFAQILRDDGDAIAERDGARPRIVANSDPLKGSLDDPDGLDAAALLAAVGTVGRLDAVPARDRGWDAPTTIERADADVVVELSK